MFENTTAYWHGELGKLRTRGQRQSPGPTVRLVRRLSPADRVAFYNSMEIVDRAADQHDSVTLTNMRAAAARQPASDLRTLTVAAIDAHLTRRPQLRQRPSTRRHYLEVRASDLTVTR